MNYFEYFLPSDIEELEFNFRGVKRWIIRRGTERAIEDLEEKKKNKHPFFSEHSEIFLQQLKKSLQSLQGNP